MAVRDENFGANLTLVEGGDGIWSPSDAAPACAPRAWRSEYEREHARAERERARADVAEARCEELRWAEVGSRARAGSLKWQLDRSRSKLKAAVEETREVRRTAKDALSLQAEVTRLEKLLSEASIEQAKRRPTSTAGREGRRLSCATPRLASIEWTSFPSRETFSSSSVTLKNEVASALALAVTDTGYTARPDFS